jgi:hypothetical protein
MVAVHNDYVLGRGKHARKMTFWLFTHPTTGRFVKGEGVRDADALGTAWQAIHELPAP